jgi:hypothetical protein
MYEIQCRWSRLVVYRSLERMMCRDWLDLNNDPDIFVIVKVKS